MLEENDKSIFKRSSKTFVYNVVQYDDKKILIWHAVNSELCVSAFV